MGMGSMRGSRLTSGLVASLVVMALVLSACSSSPHASSSSTAAGSGGFKAGVYKVGGVFALTGSYSGTDIGSAASLEATVAEINASGGVLGHKLEYKIVDDASNPSKAVLATQELISDFQPNVMFPGIECELASAGVPVTDNAHVLSFTGCDDGTDTTASKFPYNFASFPPESTDGPSLVQGAAIALKGEKPVIGYLHSNDAAGTGEVPSVEQATKAAGYKWVGDQAFAVGTADLTVQMSQLKQAGANVVILWGQVGDAGTAMKAAAALNWNVQVVGNTGVTDSSLVSEIPAGYVTNFHAVADAISVRVPGRGLPAFVNSLSKFTNYGPVSNLSVVGAVHDGLMIWKWAVEKAKSVDPTKVIKALDSMKNLKPSQFPSGLLLVSNPAYTSAQHGELYANLVHAWGLISASTSVEGSYTGTLFTCNACKS
jgi:branched-chain amino acid transport system substrate-binding protein